MALFQAPILTDGAYHSAQQFRMLVRDLARANEGITQGDDLKVTALSTPGSQVQISDGSGIIRGRANTFQGSYAVCNVGTATLDIAPTGGTGRSDMICVRVEDPEYEGTLDPALQQIEYFQVISGVTSTATAIPDSRTAIPLARIDIPASTSIITNAMITDLRKIANPRRDRSLWLQSPASLSTEISGSSGSFSYFTTAAGWTIPIPAWAGSVKIKIDVGQLRYSTGTVYGYLRATFGSSLTVQQVVLDDNQGSVVRRQTVVLGDTLTIPATYRGTNQLLRLQAAGGTGNAGKFSVDSSTTLIADVEFFEAPY
ncbi:hypothetical protein ACH4TX_41900 [Streptomyces sp. NPDC021098]|uniref:hypothetical protein n=1 Tax=unclassified Streptomyces TaxID=2593676 RepID=UPI0037B89991